MITMSEQSTNATERPKDHPLQMDIVALAGHATAEYDLSPEEIAQTLRKKAKDIEDDMMLERMYLGSNRSVNSDTDRREVSEE